MDRGELFLLMHYPCSICLRNVGVNAIFCIYCNQWTNRKSGHLTLDELNHYSLTEEDWFCNNCILALFPFSQITDDEFI